MKKVAVLVGGEYRHLDVAVKSWEPIINYGCDFYFSLWDSTQIKSKYYKPHHVDRTPVTEDMITNFIPNAKVLLSNESKESTITENQIKVLVHWKKLIDMVSNNDYDILVIMRTDLYFNLERINFVSLFENIADGSLHGKTFIPSSYTKEFENNLFDDCFFMGYSDVVKHFINSIDFSHPELYYTHKYLRDLCQSLSISVSPFTNTYGTDNGLYAIVRPTIKNIDLANHNYHSVHICEHYFGLNNIS